MVKRAAGNQNGGRPELRVTRSAAMGILFKPSTTHRFTGRPLFRSAASSVTRRLLSLTLLLTVPLFADMTENSTPRVDTVSVGGLIRPLALNPSNLSVYAGPSILKSGVGLGLGVNLALPNKLGLEIGAVVPHPVHDYAHDSSFAPGPPADESITARVKSYGEIHIVGLYTLAKTEEWTWTAGLGLSLGLITNSYNKVETTPGLTTATQPNSHKLVPAPRIQSALSYALSTHCSLRIALAYTYYSNADSLDTRSYELSFGGVTIEPGVEWRF